MDDLDLLVGRIARTHGIRGDVIVNPETDFPEERFVEGRVLQLEMAGTIGADRRSQSVRFHQGRPIVGFAGVETMDAAEALVGRGVEGAGGGDCRRCRRGTYYRHDLVGCEVTTRRGRRSGA